MNRYIDASCSPEESLLLRYHKGICFDGITRDDLKAVSIREGSRIIKLLDYKGVAVYLADESTLMATGTFKALEACFIIALCKKKHYDRIVFSSGANLGSALAFYGRKADIETYFFHPENTSWKLDRKLFDSPATHLVSVDKPEKEVKKAAQLFAEMSGIRHVPEMNWRFSATGLRALFVFEFMATKPVQFDWVSQAICAGYGPIGFYNTAREAVKEGILARERVPRFLGIQQEALAPMVRAWQKQHRQIQSDDIASHTQDLLDASLYNTNPESSYPILYQHLLDFGGQLCSLSRKEYDHHLPTALNILAHSGIQLNKRVLHGKEEILENAGLITISGTLKAIDTGVIKRGESVLSFFTGGSGSHSGSEAIPEYRITREEDLAIAARRYAQRVLPKCHVVESRR